MKKIHPCVAIAIISLALAGCKPSLGTSPEGLERPIEKAVLQFLVDIQDSGYKLITTDELKQWFDEGRKITIVSAIPEERNRRFGMMPNALRAPMPWTEKELTQGDRDNLLKIVGPDREQTIVVYCGFIKCRRSHIASKILADHGYRNVYRYPWGITTWREMAYPRVSVK